MKALRMGIGFRVLKRRRKVGDEVIERYRGLPVANISDSMSRMTAGGSRVQPMHVGSTIIGPAITVKTRPGDNLMTHKALDLAEPGDVIVVDAGGDLTNAIIGELMIAYAVERRLGGFIINGAVRDSGAIRRGTFPVYAAGVTHRGPYKDGPGEINVPIAIDGMVIEPGDLIVGDEDGFLCVPFDDVDRIYEAAAAKKKAEERSMIDIQAGVNDRTWIDEALTAMKCEIQL